MEYNETGRVIKNEDEEVNRDYIIKGLMCHHLDSTLKAMRSHVRLLSKGMTSSSRSSVDEGVGGTGGYRQGDHLGGHILLHVRDDEDLS